MGRVTATIFKEQSGHLTRREGPEKYRHLTAEKLSVDIRQQLRKADRHAIPEWTYADARLGRLPWP